SKAVCLVPAVASSMTTPSGAAGSPSRLERRSEATVRVSVHDQFSVTDTCTLSELVFEVVERSICEIVPSQAFIVAFPVGSLGRLICPPCRLGRADLQR